MYCSKQHYCETSPINTIGLLLDENVNPPLNIIMFQYQNNCADIYWISKGDSHFIKCFKGRLKNYLYQRTLKVLYFMLWVARNRKEKVFRLEKIFDLGHLDYEYSHTVLYEHSFFTTYQLKTVKPRLHMLFKIASLLLCGFPANLFVSFYQHDRCVW